jgi:hypothetical protein
MMNVITDSAVGTVFVDICHTTVRSTAGHAIHMQFDISANTLEIRAKQGPKCIVWCGVDCTITILYSKLTGVIESACAALNTSRSKYEWEPRGVTSQEHLHKKYTSLICIDLAQIKKIYSFSIFII